MRAMIERNSKYARLFPKSFVIYNQTKKAAAASIKKYIDDLPLANASSWSHGERLEGCFIVVGILSWCIGHPTFGVEGVRVGKILGATVRGPLVDTDDNLSEYQL